MARTNGMVLSKTPTGIRGFDEVLGGGLIEGELDS